VAFKRHDFKEGTNIPSDVAFVIIVSGTLHINSGPTTLTTKSDGAFFSRNFKIQGGQKGKKDMSAVAGTQVVAATEGTALTCTQKALNAFIDAGEGRGKVVKSMMWGNLESQLQKVPFIAEAKLADDKLRALGEVFTFQANKEKEQVVKQGDKADDFYIVLNGQVDVTVNVGLTRQSSEALQRMSKYSDAGSEEEAGKALVPVESLGAGSYFGEMGLVVNETRSATVATSEKSLFVRISKENFEKFISVAPQIKEAINTHCKKRLFEKFQRLRVPIFSDLGDHQLTEASERASLLFCKPGEVICNQGDEGKHFSVIVGGSVDVESKGSLLTGDENTPRPAGDDNGLTDVKTTLYQAQYFGEISMLLDHTPVQATCVANAEKGCTLMQLAKDDFRKLFGDDMNLLAELALKIRGDKCTLAQVLDHPGARRLFHELLKAEFADEHIDFFDETAGHDQLSPEDQATAAKKMLELYVKDGANKQVNIPDKMRKKLEKTIGAGETGMGLFHDARKELYTLMQRDNFRRFNRSEPFHNLLEEMGAYNVQGRISVTETDKLDAATEHRVLTPRTAQGTQFYVP